MAPEQVVQREYSSWASACRVVVTLLAMLTSWSSLLQMIDYCQWCMALQMIKFAWLSLLNYLAKKQMIDRFCSFLI
jgi:hypothetical protein